MAVASQVVAIIMGLFIVGAIGATALITASNATNYQGAPAPVIAIFTVAIPIISGVAVMMYFLPRRALGFASRLWKNRRAAISGQIVAVIMALFIVGAIGGTAVVMITNSTYTGVNAAVVTVFTVAIPIMAGVGIMLVVLPRRG
jgi:hypothetical protein